MQGTRVIGVHGVITASLPALFAQLDRTTAAQYAIGARLEIRVDVVHI